MFRTQNMKKNVDVGCYPEALFVVNESVHILQNKDKFPLLLSCQKTGSTHLVLLQDCEVVFRMYHPYSLCKLQHFSIAPFL